MQNPPPIVLLNELTGNDLRRTGLQQSSGINDTVGSHSQWPARPVDGNRDRRPVRLQRDSSRIRIRPGWLVIDFSQNPVPTLPNAAINTIHCLDDSWMN